MSGRHTPGPWHVRTLENFGFNVVHYKDGDRFDIVRVAKCGSEADADLTAAAPDLLAQLQFAVTLLNALPGFRGTAQVERMEAAIAKARGHD